MAHTGRQDGDLPEEFQSFIQVMSQKGVFSDNEFKAAINHVIGTDNFSQAVKIINKELADIELAIQPARCEITGTRYWVFASTTVDDADDQVDPAHNLDEDGDEEGVCVWFSKAKLELLRMIIQVILTSESNCISKNDCINLVSSIESKKSFSRGSADNFLKQMIHGSWLFALDGYVYLGARGIAELMLYLKSEDPNLKSCLLCKQTVVYGRPCESCDKKMHFYCLANYFKITGGQQCPGCSRNLPVSNQLLARYSHSDEDNEDLNRHAGVNRTEEPIPGPSSSRRRRRRIDDD